MSLNCNEINLVLSELDLEGAFIQDVIQPGFDTLALYTYKNSTAKTVLICTAPKSCRISETRKKIPKNEKPLRFMEFLKSRIKGSKIISCRQLGLERIIRFDLTHGEQAFIMYVRLWSNAGNIILCDSEGNVLDSMFRRPNKDEITGGKYSEPDTSKKTVKEFPIRDFSELKEEYNTFPIVLFAELFSPAITVIPSIIISACFIFAKLSIINFILKYLLPISFIHLEFSITITIKNHKERFKFLPSFCRHYLTIIPIILNMLSGNEYPCFFRNLKSHIRLSPHIRTKFLIPFRNILTLIPMAGKYIRD